MKTLHQVDRLMPTKWWTSSLVLLLHFAFLAESRDINIDWSLPVNGQAYPELSVEPNDKIIWTWSGNHAVFYHPLGACDKRGRTLIGRESPTSYTFDEADSSVVGEFMAFADDLADNCAMGMRIKVRVQTPTPSPTNSPTPAPQPQPTKAPTVVTSSPTSVPTSFPTRSPTPAPTKGPTPAPNPQTAQPTNKPATKFPTRRPTESPTWSPTADPTGTPTSSPVTLRTSPPVVGFELPTLSPDIVDAVVRVSYTVVVTNGVRNRIDSSRYKPDLIDAMDAVATEVALEINDDDNNNRRILQPRTRLQLAVNLPSTIDQIDDVGGFTDTPMLTGDGTYIGEGLCPADLGNERADRCEHVHASVELSIVESDETPLSVRNRFQTALRVAVQEGRLEDALDSQSPNSVVTVITGKFSVPGAVFETEAPSPDEDNGDNGIATGILIGFIVSGVAVIVAVTLFAVSTRVPDDETTEKKQEGLKITYVFRDLDKMEGGGKNGMESWECLGNVTPPPEENVPVKAVIVPSDEEAKNQEIENETVTCPLDTLGPHATGATGKHYPAPDATHMQASTDTDSDMQEQVSMVDSMSAMSEGLDVHPPSSVNHESSVATGTFDKYDDVSGPGSTSPPPTDDHGSVPSDEESDEHDHGSTPSRTSSANDDQKLSMASTPHTNDSREPLAGPTPKRSNVVHDPVVDAESTDDLSGAIEGQNAWLQPPVPLPVLARVALKEDHVTRWLDTKPQRTTPVDGESNTGSGVLPFRQTHVPKGTPMGPPKEDTVMDIYGALSFGGQSTYADISRERNNMPSRTVVTDNDFIQRMEVVDFGDNDHRVILQGSSSTSSAASLGDLEAAIGVGDWATVGATAAAMARFRDDSSSDHHSMSKDSGSGSAFTTDTDIAYPASLDTEKAAELDFLIDQGNWEAVAEIAVALEAGDHGKIHASRGNNPPSTSSKESGNLSRDHMPEYGSISLDEMAQQLERGLQEAQQQLDELE